MSEILGNAAVHEGLKVRGSEVPGMAQRGGSVFSNTRLGTEVYPPMTSDGKCDILVGLEPSEALRNIQYLKNTSTVILNIRRIIPATVSMGKSTYPEIARIRQKLQAAASKVITLDAVALAEKGGNRQSSNVVMLGVLSGCGNMPLKSETVKALIKERFPAKAAMVNEKTFKLGYDLC